MSAVVRLPPWWARRRSWSPVADQARLALQSQTAGPRPAAGFASASRLAVTAPFSCTPSLRVSQALLLGWICHMWVERKPDSQKTCHCWDLQGMVSWSAMHVPAQGPWWLWSPTQVPGSSYRVCEVVGIQPVVCPHLLWVLLSSPPLGHIWAWKLQLVP